MNIVFDICCAMVESSVGVVVCNDCVVVCIWRGGVKAMTLSCMAIL